jgi:hypothetical protein
VSLIGDYFSFLYRLAASCCVIVLYFHSVEG